MGGVASKAARASRTASFADAVPTAATTMMTKRCFGAIAHLENKLKKPKYLQPTNQPSLRPPTAHSFTSPNHVPVRLARTKNGGFKHQHETHCSSLSFCLQRVSYKPNRCNHPCVDLPTTSVSPNQPAPSERKGLVRLLASSNPSCQNGSQTPNTGNVDAGGGCN